jgi:predicted nucleic acid-binding protein
MNVFVDTSVWSLALRRTQPPSVPQVQLLAKCLERGDVVITTGLVLQELLQGFGGPKAKGQIIQRFSHLPTIAPEIEDHIEAADLKNLCRRKGVQVSTIDALIAQLCIRHDLPLLTTDEDFRRIARHSSLELVIH